METEFSIVKKGPSIIRILVEISWTSLNYSTYKDYFFLDGNKFVINSMKSITLDVRNLSPYAAIIFEFLSN